MTRRFTPEFAPNPSFFRFDSAPDYTPYIYQVVTKNTSIFPILGWVTHIYFSDSITSFEKLKGNTQMSIAQLDNTARCQHLRVSGRPCKAPARRGTKWCLFHAAEHNEAPLPLSSSIDDAAGIHAAVGQVLFDLQRDCIDFRRAALLFSGLRIARANLKQLGRELGDEIEPSGVRPAAVGQSRRDAARDAELEAMPSLAESLLPMLSEMESDAAVQTGEAPPPPIDVAAAKANGDLAQRLLHRLDAALDTPLPRGEADPVAQPS